MAPIWHTVLPRTTHQPQLWFFGGGEIFAAIAQAQTHVHILPRIAEIGLGSSRNQFGFVVLKLKTSEMFIIAMKWTEFTASAIQCPVSSPSLPRSRSFATAHRLVGEPTKWDCMRRDDEAARNSSIPRKYFPSRITYDRMHISTGEMEWTSYRQTHGSQWDFSCAPPFWSVLYLQIYDD